MSNAARRVTQAEKAAIRHLGGRAEDWLQRPNRWLTNLTPREVAASSDGGLRVVLLVLDRYSGLEVRILESLNAEDGR